MELTPQQQLARLLVYSDGDRVDAIETLYTMGHDLPEEMAQELDEAYGSREAWRKVLDPIRPAVMARTTPEAQALREEEFFRRLKSPARPVAKQSPLAKALAALRGFLDQVVMPIPQPALAFNAPAALASPYRGGPFELRPSVLADGSCQLELAVEGEEAAALQGMPVFVVSPVDEETVLEAKLVPSRLPGIVQATWSIPASQSDLWPAGRTVRWEIHPPEEADPA